jgi:hypothetical protein
MFTAYLIILLLIILAGFINGLFHHRFNTVTRPIIILLGVTFVIELSGYFFAKYLRNNSPVYHLFNPIQAGLQGWFFYIASDRKMVKKVVLSSSIGLILFSLVYSLVYGIMRFPGFFLIPETLVLITWGSLLFIQMLDMPAGQNIFKNPVFIIATAVIWFNLFSFIFFLLYNYLVKNNLSTDSLRMIHFFSNYIYYILLFIAISLTRSDNKHERPVKQ